ncbi:MAG: MFS transporter [Thermoanaerobaculia bacterium]
MPVLARKLFVDDAAGNGYLIGAVGAGALLAALALSMVTPKRMLRMIVATTALFGLALGAVGFVDDSRAVMALLVLCGIGMVTSLALCNTLIQARTPDSMRGRVMSMYTFSWFAFTPFGNLMAGLLAEERGIAQTMWVLGGALVVTALAVAGGGARLTRS